MCDFSFLVSQPVTAKKKSKFSNIHLQRGENRLKNKDYEQEHQLTKEGIPMPGINSKEGIINTELLLHVGSSLGI